MIPYAIDPSLYTAEPGPALLDDGFSPPPRRESLREDCVAAAPSLAVEDGSQGKRPFRGT
jgi:hypothetical protein